MHPLKVIGRFRFPVLLTGLIALWASADAQTPAPDNQPDGSPVTNSAPAAVAPSVPVSVTNQPPQVPPAEDSIDSVRQKAKVPPEKNELFDQAQKANIRKPLVCIYL
jgi:hypothetical protein